MALLLPMSLVRATVTLLLDWEQVMAEQLILQQNKANKQCNMILIEWRVADHSFGNGTAYLIQQ